MPTVPFHPATKTVTARAIRLFLCMLLTVVFYPAQAQKESNNWYFGANAGITFNSGTPVALTNSQMNQREGNATISDANGNLLFYTDGQTIWNRNHAVMLNGTGLYGDNISAQSAIIAPMPGNALLYYVFTISDWQNTGSTAGLSYSIVDMSLDNGNGAVTTKNTSLNILCREQVAAVYHRNCQDIWIIAHEQPNNNFVAYRLTTSGVITTPVISATGPVNFTNIGVNRYGGLKISPDARRICSTLGGAGTQTAQLYDFDNATGIISNPLIITSATYPVGDAYSSEFSPDNTRLYVISYTNTYIYQYDITQGTAAAIMASRVNIGSGTYNKACLQMGPDKKIYVSQDGYSYLGVINNPNAAGAASNFVENGVSLAGRTGRLGLPTFLQTFLSYPYLGKDTSVCTGTTLLLDGYLAQGATYLWQDGSVSPTLSVSQPGTYWVEATNNGCSRRDSIVVSTHVCATVTPSFTAPDTVCVNSPVAINNTTTGAGSYYWTFCSANLTTTVPTGTDLGNLGALSQPVFTDYIKVNNNYYGFITNHYPGGLIRLDFGNSLLNTPTATNLGNFGGNIPPGYGTEGMQIVYNEGNYYVILVGGYPPSGSTSRLLTINFGPNITNPAPTISNWGNIGNMAQPLDLYVFKDDNTNNWYGFTVNAQNNTITRFDFTNSFSNTPTAINLGNIGGLNYPVGIYAINDNGNWRVFITNDNNPLGTLTRLDFGNSLLNIPTGVNLGNIGGTFHAPRDLTILRSCGQTVGFLVNGAAGYYSIVRLDFSNGLASPPVATNLGNIGNLNFPHSISRLFRVNENLYGFVTNVTGNTLTRLQFNGCTNASIPNSTAQNPPPITYNTPGTYNINLTIDDGLPSQDAYCRQVVVIPPPTLNLGNDTIICPSGSLLLDAGNADATYLWQDGSTGRTFNVTASGTYRVTVTSTAGCSAKDTIVVTKSLLPFIDFSMTLNPCNPLSVSFSGIGPGALSPWWDFGDGSPAFTGNASPVHLYAAFGDYTVRFTDRSGPCTDTITKIISVRVTPADIITTSDTTICPGSSKKLLALPALSYCWTPAAYLDNPAIATPTTSTPGTITYYLNAQVQGANLIVNGDFNAGNTGFSSGYQYKPPPNTTEGQYYVGANPNAWNGGLSNCRDHTTGAGNMLLVNGSPALNVKVWTQTINVTPNTTYAFSTWIQTLYTPNPAQLQFSINGLDIGNPITASLPTCTWTQFYTTWNSGSNTTAVISIVNKNTLVLGNDFALDDISFSPLIIKRDSVTITVDTPVIKATNDTMMCQGSAMQLNAAGGVSYTWSPATGLSNPAIANPVAAPAASARYIVTGTDGYGCAAKDTVNITVNPLPVTDFGMQLDPCNPLSVTLTNIGAALPASWWDLGDGNTLTGVSTTTHTYAAPGDYTLRFSLSTATCTDTVTKTIFVGVIPDNIITTPDTTICTGSTKKLFAVPALSYCWTPATYLDNPAIATPVTSAPVKTTYYLNALLQGTNQIVNGNFNAGNTGFTSSYNYKTINTAGNAGAGEYTVGAVPQAWNPGFSPCVDHTSGSGNMLLINGAGNPGTSVWSTTVTVTPNTSYSFSCWVESMNNISPAQLQFSINNKLLGNIFTASGTACTWSQFYTSWNSGNTTTATIAIVNQNTAVTGNDFALDDISFTPLTIKRDSITISIDTPVVKATNDTTACLNTAVQLNAGGAVLYTWTPAAGLSNTAIANPIASPPATTQYIVSGTNQYGCMAKDTLLLTVNPLPVITLTADTTICHDQPLQLYAQGGTGYAWTPATTLNDSSLANPVASPVYSTIYTVVVTDANKCSSKAPVVVTVQQPPVFSVSGNNAACKGTPVQLLAKGGNVYTWTPADGLSDPNAANPLAAPDASTVYQVKIIETSCMDSALLSTSLRIMPVPTVTAHKSNDIDCAVPMSLLSAAGAIRYLWSPGTGLSDSLIYDPVAKPTTTTTYIVSGIGANGCVGYDSVKVMVDKVGDLLFNIPNAFTPNNDGHNDCFGAGRYAALINSMEIAVYNRWGTRLFYSTSPNACWDGTYNGKPQDPGGYPYIIRAKTLCGEVVKKGVLILVR